MKTRIKKTRNHRCFKTDHPMPENLTCETAATPIGRR